MQYRFTCNYSSGFGAWSQGDVAEFDADTAAWLLRDVAECIAPVDAQDAPDEADAETRAVDAPQHDRQLKRPPRDRQKRPDEGVMTPENSGAVRRDTD